MGRSTPARRAAPAAALLNGGDLARRLAAAGPRTCPLYSPSGGIRNPPNLLIETAELLGLPAAAVVTGYLSPYPTVVTVVVAQQRAPAKLVMSAPD